MRKDDVDRLIELRQADKVINNVQNVTSEVTPDVDDINMKQDRVDETAKGEHEWVGLTTSEVIECQEASIYDTYINIEAKLKEKNGG